MKRNFTLLLTGLISFVFLAGCATSNDVASNGIIQKRKYNKGFFVKMGSKKATVKKQKQTDFIVQNNQENPSTTKVPESMQAENTQIVKQEAAVAMENKAQLKSSINPSQSEAILQPKAVKSAHKKIKVADKIKVLKQIKELKNIKKEIVKSTSTRGTASDDDLDPIVYYLLAFFIPFVAVGLVTDWDVKQVVINILLCCLCGIPGIIHAFIVVSKNV